MSSRARSRRPQPRRKNSAEERRLYRARVRRRRMVIALCGLAAAVAVVIAARPRGPHMTPLEARIVSYAESQIGYRTNPVHSYCNKFSAFWHAGANDCPPGERDEEWCADFAAWVWQKAGVPVTYGYGPGEINGAAASFYEWGVAHHRWHPAGSGYLAKPGDVAVYGLRLGAVPTAVHVAVVTDDPPGQAGPDVVNGDGDKKAFSDVEAGSDELFAQALSKKTRLAGYVSPPLPAKSPR